MLYFRSAPRLAEDRWGPRRRPPPINSPNRSSKTSEKESPKPAWWALPRAAWISESFTSYGTRPCGGVDPPCSRSRGGFHRPPPRSSCSQCEGEHFSFERPAVNRNNFMYDVSDGNNCAGRRRDDPYKRIYSVNSEVAQGNGFVLYFFECQPVASCFLR